MILQAQTISSLVCDELNHGPASGSVHSVFAGTVNIACGRSIWLSLHAPGTPLHPYAVVLGKGAGSNREECPTGGGAFLGASAGGAFLGASRGERVDVEGGEIAVGGGRAIIRLAGAEVWRPEVGRLDAGLRGDADGLLETLLEGLRNDDMASPFLNASGTGEVESALIHKCLRIRAGLARSWRRGDVSEAARIMQSAVGLGSGLTPSGDDFLTGFLGAAHMFAYGSGAADDARRHLCIERSMTTLTSYFMLRGALHGLLPEPLSSLLGAIACGRPGPIRRSVERLVRLGSTSGQDMLAGVVCYLEAARAAGEME